MNHSRLRSSRLQKQMYAGKETGSGSLFLVKEANHGR